MALYFHCDNSICYRKAKPKPSNWLSNEARLPEGWTVKSEVLLTNKGPRTVECHFCPSHSIKKS